MSNILTEVTAIDTLDDIFTPFETTRIFGVGTKVVVRRRNPKVAYENLLGVVERVSTRKLYVRMLITGKLRMFDSEDLEILPNKKPPAKG
jgi:hypothetical protein